MKTPDDEFRSDLKGRAKDEFRRPKEKASELPAKEKNKSELDKWKQPKPELKPDGGTREIIDRRLFAEDLNADAENAFSQAGQTAAAVHEMNRNSTPTTEVSVIETAQALLASYNKSATSEIDPNFGR
jgi:hypothetical protein